MRRALFLIIVGLGGTAILIGLGIWQVQRLAWKQDVIAQIEARIDGTPVQLPQQPDQESDSYLPVTVTGTIAPDFLRVLVSQKVQGAGHRIIAPLTQPDGARVMVDLGFVGANRSDFALATSPLTVIGNLQWPQETDSFTPEPDVEGNTWFARDVPAMAAALGTSPVLVVARAVAPDVPNVTPLPVDTARIPNNHLQYAITWFSLAAIWLAMSLYFLRARAQKTES